MKAVRYRSYGDCGVLVYGDAGDLTIHIAQRRPLADLPAVHDQAAAGQLPGETILTP
jgi:hypothetical protein